MSLLFKKLEDVIAGLPGLGRRSATRILFKMLSERDRLMVNFAELLLKAASNIKYCKDCNNITECDFCDICQDQHRNKKSLCIVNSVSDLLAIENAKIFNGLYHVVYSDISDCTSINGIDFSKLIAHIINNKFDEIILASNSTVYGQTLMFYLHDLINEELHKLNYTCKISTLGKGIPLGSEINHLDEGTIIASFAARANL